MTNFSSFHHHYCEVKLLKILRPIWNLLSQIDLKNPELKWSSDARDSVEDVQSPNDGPPSPVPKKFQPLSHPKFQRADLVVEDEEHLQTLISSLVSRIDCHVDDETKNEWVKHSTCFRNLCLCYDILKLDSFFFGPQHDGNGNHKSKKSRFFIFIATIIHGEHRELLERVVSYLWHQGRLLHVTDELVEYSKINPDSFLIMSDLTPKRGLLNITEKDIDLIKKIIEQKGRLHEVRRGEESVVLVKEVAFTELCQILRNTYGYKTKMFKRFLEKYHRKHFFLRESKLKLDEKSSQDNISSSPQRIVLMVSPYEPSMNFNRDAAIMQRILVAGRDELNNFDGGKKKSISQNRQYRLFFQELLEKLNEETGSSKHKGYLKQLKTNSTWKHVFNVEKHVTLQSTGGYNRKIVNNINKMFSERQKIMRKKLEEEGLSSQVVIINTTDSRDEKEEEEEEQEKEEIKKKKEEETEENTKKEKKMMKMSPLSIIPITTEIMNMEEKKQNSEEISSSDKKSEFEEKNNSSSSKKKSFKVVISPIRRDIRIPVSEIETKNLKQFIAYINCWHFDKFQILPGGEKGPMIRKQMVDLKDVNNVISDRRRIPAMELLSMLKKENQKKYGYIQEEEFIQWLGENFPDRSIVVNDYKYVLLLDDDLVFRLNLFKIIQYVHMHSRKTGGFGIIFNELLMFAKKNLKLKHFKKIELEKYLKQYNNIFKVCCSISLRKWSDQRGGGGGGRRRGEEDKYHHHHYHKNGNSNIFGQRRGQQKGGLRGRSRDRVRGRGQRRTQSGRGRGYHLINNSNKPPTPISSSSMNIHHKQQQKQQQQQVSSSPTNIGAKKTPFFLSNVNGEISGMKRGVLLNLPKQKKKLARIVDPETGKDIDLHSSTSTPTSSSSSSSSTTTIDDNSKKIGGVGDPEFKKIEKEEELGTVVIVNNEQKSYHTSSYQPSSRQQQMSVIRNKKSDKVTQIKLMKRRSWSSPMDSNKLDSRRYGNYSPPHEKLNNNKKTKQQQPFKKNNRWRNRKNVSNSKNLRSPKSPNEKRDPSSFFRN